MQNPDSEASPRKSLIPCIDCGQPVSPRALLCPQCGSPLGQSSDVRRYPLLKYLAQILKVLATVTLTIGLPITIPALIYSGIGMAIVVLLGSIFLSIHLGITSELIYLLIDIEGNTRVLRRMLFPTKNEEL